MNKEMTSQAEGDGEILTFDISDDALERAANAEQNAFTMVYCTNDWYNCGIPLSRANGGNFASAAPHVRFIAGGVEPVPSRRAEPESESRRQN